MHFCQQLRQLLVARHRKQNARHGGLRHQGVGNPPGDHRRPHGDILQPAAARQIRGIVEGGIEAAKRHALRQIGGNPRLQDKQRTDQHQRAQRRLTHGIHAAFRFLGQRGDPVEAEEREHGDGDRAHHQRQAELIGVIERVEGQMARPGAGVERNQPENDEHRQHHDLRDQNRVIGARGKGNAAQVNQAVNRNKADNPQPARHARQHRRQRRRADDIEQRRHQNIVQQDQPASKKADNRMNTALGIRVYRSGDRERARHRPVAHGGKEHRHHTDEISQRHHALRAVPDVAKDAKRRDGHHKYHAVDQQIAERQRPMQLLLIAKLFNAHACSPSTLRESCSATDFGKA